MLEGHQATSKKHTLTRLSSILVSSDELCYGLWECPIEDLSQREFGCGSKHLSLPIDDSLCSDTLEATSEFSLFACYVGSILVLGSHLIMTRLLICDFCRIRWVPLCEESIHRL